MTKSAVETLADALRAAERGLIAVITGAGISFASGIPTFRGTDRDAVWKRDVTELGTNHYFEQDPLGSWTWYTSRFDHVLDKQPNAAHHALVGLEQWHIRRGGRYLLVTQNVDPLHEAAGARHLIKVHGSADRVRCSQRGCKHGAPAGSILRRELDMSAFYESPSHETLPRCPACGALLRQHVLLFDEFYDEHEDYQWSRVLLTAQTMDLALFVGTSFSVGVTDLFLQSAHQRRIPIFGVDPGAAKAPHPGVTMLREKCEELLPSVYEALHEE